ncbi:MAG: hypothetical protein EAZ30_02935 [Betaproteobacteria bacterium]|nr:MAG: hypothetical protein EAZ30_02935 [Betaproteobacteria bacterium]
MQTSNRGSDNFVRLIACAVAVLLSGSSFAVSEPPMPPIGCENVDRSAKTTSGFSTPSLARRFEALTNGKTLRVRMALASTEDHQGVLVSVHESGAWERADSAFTQWRVERAGAMVNASGEMNAKRTPQWVRYELPGGERRCTPIRRFEPSTDPVVLAFTQPSVRSAP